jgi:hypothetical protein
MAKHTTTRGTVIDMGAMRRENEKVPAIGNMKVNAKGDKIKNGVVTKSAEEIARERHRVQSVMVQSGVKGPISNESLDQKEPARPAVKPAVKKETELPSGDIIINNDKS